MSQIKAGMPGYMVALRDGVLAIDPRDEVSNAVREMVQAMLDSNVLDTAALKAEAAQAEGGIALLDVPSVENDAFPQGSFMLRCAGYADTDDIVISIVRREELSRYGSGRTWCLVVLTLAVFIFLGMAIWHADLYTASAPQRLEHAFAYLSCKTVFILACIVLLICVLDIQMISSVNQSQESTASSVAYLHNILDMETERADVISSQFDVIYQKRANVAAKVLSHDPQLIHLDALRDLDAAMDGIGLQVFDTNGKLIASDELYYGGTAAENAKEKQRKRVYRAPLMDEHAQTTGFVTLLADQTKLDSMLANTQIEAVLSETHLANGLQVIVIDKTDRQTITAGSQPTWIGDSASDRGIPSHILYDGYETVLKLKGDQVYGMVFAYGNSLILVTSRNVSFTVFLIGLSILTLVLILLLAVFYFLMVRDMYALQAANSPSEPRKKEAEALHQPFGIFLQYFMFVLFVLTAVIFLITRDKPSTLAYKIVRGQWTHGINAVTVTTLLMIISVVATVTTILRVILNSFSKRMSPWSKTICHMIVSTSHYIATIILILYALSMFGVNTTTLLGGAGIIALVFTFGANSMISDVLAGLFIIFDGDIMVDDIVTIKGFRGRVTDITMRTTKLKDDNTQDITVISNSQISDFVKQTSHKEIFYVDIKLSHDVGLVKGEKIVRETLAKLPERCPEIIGKPQYVGVVELPSHMTVSDKIGTTTLRVAFTCREDDKELLTYKLQRELVWVAHLLLNDDTQVGIEGCKIVDPLENASANEA